MLPSLLGQDCKSSWSETRRGLNKSFIREVRVHREERLLEKNRRRFCLMHILSGFYFSVFKILFLFYMTQIFFFFNVKWKQGVSLMLLQPLYCPFSFTLRRLVFNLCSGTRFVSPFFQLVVEASTWPKASSTAPATRKFIPLMWNVSGTSSVPLATGSSCLLCKPFFMVYCFSESAGRKHCY